MAKSQAHSSRENALLINTIAKKFKLRSLSYKGRCQKSKNCISSEILECNHYALLTRYVSF